MVAFLAVPAAAQTAERTVASTALFAEAPGVTNRYAVGIEQAVRTNEGAAISVRLGLSYTDTGADRPDRLRVFSIPAGAVLRVPVVESPWPIYLEAEGGLVFARWDGAFEDIDGRPGEVFRLLQHASGFVRTKVAGPVFVRGGYTTGGLHRGRSWSPTVGVGLGLR